jgi:molybdopterin-synthase adenylyltransferase
MNGARITLLGSQHEALTKFLDSHTDGHEKAAVVLFRRLHIPIEGLEDSDRYIAHHIIPFEDAWVTSSSPAHIAFALEPLRELFRKCEEDKLVFGFVHNHPGGPTKFSDVDDENELTLLTALRNRNGNSITFVSMLWAQGQWVARTRRASDPATATPVRHTLVLADRLHLYGYRESSADHSEVQARQAAAFGRPFVDMLQSLRVAVVGCGGTGSPLATLLARSGIGELVHIDKDKLAKSNLNRVRGLTTADVGKNKASRLKAFIDSIGLSVQVAAYESEVDIDPAALDALASCDVVIGSTDDFAGRAAMNTALYVYVQLLIDVGLGGRVLEGSDGHPVLRYHYGRISSILPEAGQCLFCQDVIRDVWIRAQQARRENPDITEEQLKERYLEDGGTGAPGVGPFTSASADFAAATLFDLIKPFRRFPPELRRDMYLVDFVTMQIRSYHTEGKHGCPYCREHEFLLMKEAHRLNQPFLGKRDELT